MSATQAPLLIEEPPKFKYRKVKTSEVVVERWGAPPDDHLKRNVAMSGVLQPVLFRENGEGKLRIVEGRRRFQAAVAAGLTEVPGLVLASDIGIGVHALELAGNIGSQNFVMDLFAVEQIMVETGTKDAVTIAMRTRIPLTRVKKILRLQTLLGEIKDAWMEGKFGNAVGMACARLETDKQQKLLERLRANGTITMKDVQDVKKTSVRSHQRALPGENRKARIRDALSKARSEAFSEWGDGDVVEAIDSVLKLVDEANDE